LKLLVSWTLANFLDSTSLVHSLCIAYASIALNSPVSELPGPRLLLPVLLGSFRSLVLLVRILEYDFRRKLGRHNLYGTKSLVNSIYQVFLAHTLRQFPRRGSNI